MSFEGKSKKEIQNFKKKIAYEVEGNIRKYVTRALVNYLDEPIIRVSSFSVYAKKSSPASQLYWSVANNKSGRFFVWSTVLSQWVDLGGPIGSSLPNQIKDKNGNVIETVDYQFDYHNIFKTKEDLLNTIPNGEPGFAYLVGAKNRLIDFLRLNLYSQFSVSFNSGPEEYLPGISRIACKELGFYSFSFTEMRGADLSKLAKYMNLLNYNKSEMFGNDVVFDSDLNGMSFEDLDAIFQDGYNKFKNNEKALMQSQNSITTDHTYEIIPIQDRPHSDAGFMPTEEGKTILTKLSKYVDWCICNDNSEFAQYTGNGGKFYICLRDDYKKIKKPQDKTDDALDDYAISMIAVLVGQDGFPDLITTRYNHNNGGENNKNLWKASQLQNILGVNYFSVFKPRNQEELTSARLTESKKRSASDQVGGMVNAGVMDNVCYGGSICEDDDEDAYEYKNISIKRLISDLANFMYNDGKLNIKPFPKVELDWSDQKGIFIKTGFYTPDDKKIVVFCKDRHIKDILRSFAHEMIHHEQNMNGVDLSFSSNDKLANNDDLKKIEGDAFLNGNLWFRRWTESIDSKKQKNINESRKNDEGKNVPYTCPECGGKIIKTIQGEPIYKCDKCNKYFGTLPFQLSENTNMDEYLDPDEVDLSSFNIKKELNPQFWKDNRIDSRVRMKLLDIADDFIKYLNVDWVEPEDIVITGSLANYNWAEKYSDVDIHVIYDFSKIDDNIEFVDEYFYSKKKLWNSEHNKINIYGFGVEMYVEDINNSSSSSGVYSLESDEWIETPNRDKLAFSKVNKDVIKNAVSYYTKKIDKLYDNYLSYGDDSYKLGKIQTKAEKLFSNIKKMRKNSLYTDKNEISNGNIIFKALRRLNYIEKLTNIISNSYDELQSI